jgi:hypothetical protein
MSVVAEFQKNARERIKISLDDFKNHKVCNIRVFYESEPGTWLPGPKGLAFSVNLLPELIAALQSAEEQRKDKKSGEEGVR